MEFCFVLVRVSIDAMKHYDQKWKGLIWCILPDLKKSGQELKHRRDREAGTEAGHGGDAACWPVLHDLCSLISYVERRMNRERHR